MTTGSHIPVGGTPTAGVHASPPAPPPPPPSEEPQAPQPSPVPQMIVAPPPAPPKAKPSRKRSATAPARPRQSKPEVNRRLSPEQREAIAFLTGMNKLRYTLRKARGKAYLVPRLTPSEQQKFDTYRAKQRAIHEEQRRQEFRRHDITAFKQWLRAVAPKVPIKMVVLNLKGGAGKTPIAALISNIVSEVTGCVVVVVPATRNPSTTTMQFGVNSDESLPLPILIGNPTNYNTYGAISPVIKMNRHNTRVMSASSITTVLQHTSNQHFAAAMEALSPTCDFLCMDGGNADGELSFEWAAADEADVLVFPCLANDHESLVSLGWTMDGLLNRGSPDKQDEVTTRKVQEDSFVVVCGLQSDEDVKHYEMFATRIIRENGMEAGARDFRGKLMGTPFDPHFQRGRAVNLHELTEDSLYAGYQLVEALYRRVAAKRDFDLSPYEALRAVPQQRIPTTEGDDTNDFPRSFASSGCTATHPKRELSR